MFGYISPDSPYLFKKDETLYKALYCGLCKSIGSGCGQVARTALTYDMAFTSALVHNIRGEDVKIKRERCAVHLIKRRPVTAVDDTTVALGCVNTVLAYFKLCDDKADGEARGALRHLYKKGYRRALKRHPEVAEIISRRTGELAELEKAGCAVIDMAAEPTAEMMREISVYLLKEFSTAETERLFYSLGKWVYLIDALDDYDKDVKKGRYNVFYNVYGEKSKAQAVEKGKEEINFIFDMLFSEMRESLKNIKFYYNHDLTDNIILRGIPIKTRGVVYG
ncbi:MAG: hypothetical protein K2K60_00770, partial [Clostridia bacterium]|nr:hypothetical protein [Clostridia bacterium]